MDICIYVTEPLYYTPETNQHYKSTMPELKLNKQKPKMKTPPNLIYTENRLQSVCGGERRAKLVKGVKRYKLPLIK